ncbi:unnamed protein product [Somion occarium]|uniref:Amidohydrolase-related domain-containing protein n=1 Tax=Somion occarium TaxID=3059160 RepID=A0ABP1DGG2_9APHY
MSTKGLLPQPITGEIDHLLATNDRARRNASTFRIIFGWVLLLTGTVFSIIRLLYAPARNDPLSNIPIDAAEILDKCRMLNVQPHTPANFYERKQSDRFQAGTNPTLITNATIWSGRLNGLEQFTGDVLLDGGIIRDIGDIDREFVARLDDLVTIDANGAWLSPGVVDMHSHLGVHSNPGLRGSSDGNSHHGPVLPWMRALDGLNTHDDAYRLSVSGGVTTALVLPGSANAIGGQGLLIKLRPTTERSPTAMTLENPYSTNTSEYDPLHGLRWRQMKHACGENPDRVYSGTRMDTTWAFRQAYDKARQIKNAQDAYCQKASTGKWDEIKDFPEDYQWEALVDVLRGRVKVHNHCYETVDLDDMVRITNEFKFSIAAFHHAHETYLVPSTLKSAYGHPPAVALFSTKARYKRESYRGSEFAPKILSENGLQVIMKSDHPVLDSRYLLYEAQIAHYFGLPPNLALAAVTSTPAEVIGEDHRIGFLKRDVVLWDSHPLSLSATPKQVWIDGIPQIKVPHVVDKPAFLQNIPKTPDFEREARKTLEYDGLPPLLPNHTSEGTVVFTNVSHVYARKGDSIVEVLGLRRGHDNGIVQVQRGEIICMGEASTCLELNTTGKPTFVNLQGGSISPGLVTFGSNLGLEDIQGEPSTKDGLVPAPLISKVPAIVGGDGAIIRAADGLQFFTRHALLAYRSGITTGIVAPQSQGLLSGLSVAFSTGSEHRLKKGAVVQNVVAVHVAISHSDNLPSVSAQVAALRNLLLGNGEGELGYWFEKVTKGKLSLVVDVHSADAIASLIELKREIEGTTFHPLKLTLSGATESYLLPSEISDADIGVILRPIRSFPSSWEMKRISPGPPLSDGTALSTLLAHKVTVAVGAIDPSLARLTRFDVGWAALTAGISVSTEEVLALASVNVEKLLGVSGSQSGDLVATQSGGLLEFNSKVAAVISSRRGLVDIF